MFLSGTVRRAAPRIKQSLPVSRRQLSSSARTSESRSKLVIYAAALAGGSVACWGVQTSRNQGFFSALDAEAPKSDKDIVTVLEQPIFEKERPQGSSKEENRDLLSTQHVQIKKSWENPGVYAWGLNSGRVVAPDSEERWIKIPRRISFFDGVLLRDIKLDRNFGAAIDEKGDLLQWGTGYSKDVRTPEVTFKGRNLKSLAISDDRIVALSENGSVYSIPASKQQQAQEPKLTESSWFWGSTTSIGCRSLTPKSLGVGERIVSVAGGLEHVLMLTSRGRVYSAASSSRDFPKHGQLGIPGLSWYTRPAGPFDQPHEIAQLRGLSIKQIAAGDNHSVVLDKSGRIFTFGNNAHGQLGVPINTSSVSLSNALNMSSDIIDSPVEVSVAQLYASSSSRPDIRSISAGGQNTYFIAESRRDPRLISSQDQKPTSDVTSDTWACGRGIWGNLGIGKWTHVQWTPVKIPALSGLYEYNETTSKPEPIRAATLKVGESHVAAVMANITQVAANSSSSASETNWGADVYFFGNNENFQLGTGKRSNLAVPSHIPPLGMKAAEAGSGIGMERFQLTPAKKITVAGRSVWVEQRVECGRQCSAVYSGTL